MHSRLKVLVLAQYFPPDAGGASTRASNVVSGLLIRRWKVSVVAAFPHYPLGNVPSKYRRKALVSEEFGAAKVLRVWIPARPHNSVLNRIFLHLCFIISSLFALPFVGDVDIVWAANPNLFSFFPALIYSLVKRKPVVRNVDDLWPEVFYELGLVRSTLMRRLLDFLAMLSYVVPSAITPISAGYKRKIVDKYGVSGKKVHVVEVGVASVQPLVQDRKKTRDRFIVMYSGVLGLGYDFDIVLDAASLLAKYADIILVIRGFGELAPQLRKQVSELDLRNVVLDTHFLPKENLSSLLHSADAFMLPMASAHFVDDGLPTKIFEYQAYGKPIICVSRGEAARYIEATKSGLIVEPKDARGFAEAIVRVYEDREFATKLGRNGWQHVSEKLTAEKIGERMHTVFASVKC